MTIKAYRLSCRVKQNQDRDKMIAAHARSLGYVLVTNNTKDFTGIDGLVLDDWREPGDLKQVGW